MLRKSGTFLPRKPGMLRLVGESQHPLGGQGQRTGDCQQGRILPTMATEPNPEFIELAHFVIDERSVRMLERGYCLENDVVVLGVVDRTKREPVTVGMLDPSRRALVHEVSKTLGRPVKAVRLNAWEIRRALDQGHGIAEEDRSRLTLRPIRDISFERAGEVPEILDEILGRAVELRASDVHVETYEDDVDVRFRIDGVLRQVATPLSRENIQGAVNRLK